MKRTLLLLGIIGLGLIQQLRADQVIKREGEPDFIRPSNEKRMNAAMAEAKSTLEEFIQALQQRPASVENFCIKKGYSVGSDGKEYIWITNVQYANGWFVGKIDNEPVDTKEVKLGQSVRVSRDEVADWMFFKFGKLQGGYTVVALAYGTADQSKWEKSMGIEWTKYKFLKAK